jgi:hypothetical protein
VQAVIRLMTGAEATHRHCFLHRYVPHEDRGSSGTTTVLLETFVGSVTCTLIMHDADLNRRSE